MRCFVILAVGLVLATSLAASSQNLVADGGFEGFVIGYPYYVMPAGFPIGPWQVEGDSIDIVRSYWQPAEGSQSIDLSGTNLGGISQLVYTSPGATYLLRFAAAPNPEQPDPKIVQVRWGSDVIDTISMIPDGCTLGAMGWNYYSYFVVGDGVDVLRFTSLGGPAWYGPALDDVSLTLVPEPSSGLALLMGACAFAASRRSRK